MMADMESQNRVRARSNSSDIRITHGDIVKKEDFGSSNLDANFKRHRAGSISGRLRAASDLEECGLIDKSQKGLLKVSCCYPKL
jgi:hypothetical protein